MPILKNFGTRQAIMHNLLWSYKICQNLKLQIIQFSPLLQSKVENIHWIIENCCRNAGIFSSLNGAKHSIWSWICAAYRISYSEYSSAAKQSREIILNNGEILPICSIFSDFQWYLKKYTQSHKSPCILKRDTMAILF